MIYSWYPAYREAMLETDQPKMRGRLLLAEKKMVDRLRVLVQDHGGTAEEREALARALTSIKNLRTEMSQGNQRSESEIA